MMGLGYQVILHGACACGLMFILNTCYLTLEIKWEMTGAQWKAFESNYVYYSEGSTWGWKEKQKRSAMMVVIPGFNDTLEEIRDIAAYPSTLVDLPPCL